MKVTSQVTRGQSVEAIILFAGCKASADGRCDVAVHWSMTGPNGEPYGPDAEVSAYKGKPAPARELQASTAALGFRFDPTDMPGRYSFRAKVIDKVAGTSITVETPLSAREN